MRCPSQNTKFKMFSQFSINSQLTENSNNTNQAQVQAQVAQAQTKG